jgi:hypothetical protein
MVGELVFGEIDLSTCPSRPAWTPRWLVECGKDSEVGITIDDHCFVVLAKDWNDNWGPATHIPWQAAVKLGELAISVTT